MKIINFTQSQIRLETDSGKEISIMDNSSKNTTRLEIFYHGLQFGFNNSDFTDMTTIYIGEEINEKYKGEIK